MIIFTNLPGHCVQVVLVLVCDCLLAIRAATGVVALYSPYQHLWINDVSYYMLDTLPELLALCILVAPTMLARIAQVYPKPPQSKEKSKEKSKKKSKQDSEGASKGRFNEQQNKQHNKKQKDASDSAHSTDSMNGGSPGAATESRNLIGTNVVLDSAQEEV